MPAWRGKPHAQARVGLMVLLVAVVIGAVKGIEGRALDLSRGWSRQDPARNSIANSTSEETKESEVDTATAAPENKKETESERVAREQIATVEEIAEEKVASINAVVGCIMGESPPEGCKHLFVSGSAETQEKQAITAKEQDARVAELKAEESEHAMREMEQKGKEKQHKQEMNATISTVEERARNLRAKLDEKLVKSKDLKRTMDQSRETIEEYEQQQLDYQNRLARARQEIGQETAELKQQAMLSSARASAMEKVSAEKDQEIKKGQKMLRDESKTASHLKLQGERLEEALLEEQEIAARSEFRAKLLADVVHKDAAALEQGSKEKALATLAAAKRKASEDFMKICRTTAEKGADRAATTAVEAGDVNGLAAILVARKAYDRVFELEMKKCQLQAHETAENAEKAQALQEQCDRDTAEATRLDVATSAAQTEADKKQGAAAQEEAQCAAYQEKAIQITDKDPVLKADAEKNAQKICASAQNTVKVADEASSALKATRIEYNDAKKKAESTCGNAKSVGLNDQLKMAEVEATQLDGVCQDARKRAAHLRALFEKASATLDSIGATQTQLQATAHAEAQMQNAETEAKQACDAYAEAAKNVAQVAQQADEAAKAAAALVPNTDAIVEAQRLGKLCEVAKQKTRHDEIALEKESGNTTLIEELKHSRGKETQACAMAAEAARAVEGDNSAVLSELRSQAAFAAAREAAIAAAAEAARLKSLCEDANADVEALELKVKAAAPENKVSETQLLIQAKGNAVKVCAAAEKATANAKALQATFEESRQALEDAVKQHVKQGSSEHHASADVPALAAQAARLQEACTEAKEKVAELQSTSAPEDSIQMAKDDMTNKCDASAAAQNKFKAAESKGEEARLLAELMKVQGECDDAKRSLAELKAANAPQDEITPAENKAEQVCAAAEISRAKANEAKAKVAAAALAEKAALLNSGCEAARKCFEELQASRAPVEEIAEADDAQKEKCAAAAAARAQVKASKFKALLAEMDAESQALQQACDKAQNDLTSLRKNSAPETEITPAENDTAAKCKLAAEAATKLTTDREAGLKAMAAQAEQSQAECEQAKDEVAILKSNDAPHHVLRAAEEVAEKRCATAAAAASALASARQGVHEDGDVDALKAEAARLAGLCDVSKRKLKSLMVKKAPAEELQPAEEDSEQKCSEAAAAAAKMDSKASEANINAMFAHAAKLRGDCEAARNKESQLREKNAPSHEISDAAQDAQTKCDAAAEAKAKAQAGAAAPRLAALAVEEARLKGQCASAKKLVAELSAKGSPEALITDAEREASAVCEKASAASASLRDEKAMQNNLADMAQQAAALGRECTAARQHLVLLKGTNASPVQLTEAQANVRTKCEAAAAAAAQLKFAPASGSNEASELAAEAARLHEECSRATSKVSALEKKEAADDELQPAKDDKKTKCDSAAAMSAKLAAFKANNACMSALAAENAIAQASCRAAQESVVQLRADGAPAPQLQTAENEEREKCEKAHAASEQLAADNAKMQLTALAEELARKQETCDESKAEIAKLRSANAPSQEVATALEISEAKCEKAAAEAAKFAAQQETYMKMLAGKTEQLQQKCTEAKQLVSRLKASKAEPDKVNTAQANADVACAAAEAAPLKMQAAAASWALVRQQAEASRLQQRCEKVQAAVAALEKAGADEAKLMAARDTQKEQCDAAAATQAREAGARNALSGALAAQQAPLRRECEAALKKVSYLKGIDAANDKVIAADDDAKQTCAAAAIAEAEAQAERLKADAAEQTAELSQLRKKCNDADKGISSAESSGSKPQLQQAAEDANVKCTASVSVAENLALNQQKLLDALSAEANRQGKVCNETQAHIKELRNQEASSNRITAADVNAKCVCATALTVTASVKDANTSHRLAKQTAEVLRLKETCVKAKATKVKLKLDEASKEEVLAAEADARTKCQAAESAATQLKAEMFQKQAAARAAEAARLQTICDDSTAEVKELIAVNAPQGNITAAKAVADRACEEASAAQSGQKLLNAEMQLAIESANAGVLKEECDLANQKVKELMNRVGNSTNGTTEELHTAQIDARSKCALAAAANKSSLTAGNVEAAKELERAKKAQLALYEEAERLDLACKEAKQTVSDVQAQWKTAVQGTETFDQLAKEVSEAKVDVSNKCTLAQAAADNLKKAQLELAGNVHQLNHDSAEDSALLATMAAQAKALQQGCENAKNKVLSLRTSEAPSPVIGAAEEDADAKCKVAAEGNKRLLAQRQQMEQQKHLAEKAARLKNECEQATNITKQLRIDFDNTQAETKAYEDLSAKLADAEEMQEKKCADEQAAVAHLAIGTSSNISNLESVMDASSASHELASAASVEASAHAKKACTAAKVAKLAARAAGSAVTTVVWAAAAAAQKIAVSHPAFGLYVHEEGNSTNTNVRREVHAKRIEKLVESAAHQSAFTAAKAEADRFRDIADAAAIECARASALQKDTKYVEQARFQAIKCEQKNADVVRITHELDSAVRKSDIVMLKSALDVARAKHHATCFEAETMLANAAQKQAEADALDAERHATVDMHWCRDEAAFAASCYTAKHLCQDKRLGTMYREQCPRTCGTCGKTQASGVKECFDDEYYAKQCPLRKDLCADMNVGRLYRIQCPKTCDVCQKMSNMGPTEMEKQDMELKRVKREVHEQSILNGIRTGRCQDTASSTFCRDQANKCRLNPETINSAVMMGEVVIVKAKCAETCNECPKPIPPSECHDDPTIGEKNCKMSKGLCFDPELGSEYKKQCPKTCLACVPDEETQESMLEHLDPCVNDPEYDRLCDTRLDLCSDFEVGLTYRKQCPRSCGVCLKDGSVDWKLQNQLKDEANLLRDLNNKVLEAQKHMNRYEVGVRIAPSEQIRLMMYNELDDAKKEAKEASEKVVQADQERRALAVVVHLQKKVKKLDASLQKVRKQLRSQLRLTSTVHANQTTNASNDTQFGFKRSIVMSPLEAKNRSLSLELNQQKQELFQAENQRALIKMKGPCQDTPGKEYSCGLRPDLCRDPQISDAMRIECPKTCGVCGEGITFKMITGNKAVPLTPADAVLYRAESDLDNARKAAANAMEDMKKAEAHEKKVQELHAELVIKSLKQKKNFDAVRLALERAKTEEEAGGMGLNISVAQHAALAAVRLVNDTMYDVKDAARIRKVAAVMVEASEKKVEEAVATLELAKEKHNKHSEKPMDVGPAKKALLVSLHLQALFEKDAADKAAHIAQANILTSSEQLFAARRHLQDSVARLTASEALLKSLREQYKETLAMKSVSIKEGVEQKMKEAEAEVEKLGKQVQDGKERVKEEENIHQKRQEIAAAATALANYQDGNASLLVKELNTPPRSSQLDITNAVPAELLAVADEESTQAKVHVTLAATRVVLMKKKVSHLEREMMVVNASLAHENNQQQQAALKTRVSFLNESLTQLRKEVAIDSENLSIDQLEAGAKALEAAEVTTEVTSKEETTSGTGLTGEQTASNTDGGVVFHATSPLGQRQQNLNTAEQSDMIDLQTKRKLKKAQARAKILGRMMAEATTEEEKQSLAGEMQKVQDLLAKEKETIAKIAMAAVAEKELEQPGFKELSLNEKLKQLTLQLANLHIERDEAQSEEVRAQAKKKIEQVQAEIDLLKKGGNEATNAAPAGAAEARQTEKASELAFEANKLDQECEASKQTLERLKVLWEKAQDGSAESNRLADEVSQAENESNKKCEESTKSAEKLAAASEAASQASRAYIGQEDTGSVEERQELDEEEKKEKDADKQNIVQEALAETVKQDKSNATNLQNEAKQALAKYEASQKKLKSDAKEANEEKASAVRLGEDLEEQKKILTAMEYAKDPGAIAEEQIAATKADSNAQEQIENALKVSEKANKEAQVIAQKMANLTNVHDAALMKQKLETTQAEAAVVKEEAKKAEVEARTADAVAMNSEKDKNSDEEEKERVADKMAAEAGGVEQAKLDLESAEAQAKAANEHAEAVKKDVEAREEEALSLQRKDATALAEAEKVSEKAQLEITNTQAAVKDKKQNALIAAIAENVTVVPKNASTSTSPEDIAQPSVNDYYRKQQADKDLSPDILNNTMKQANAARALQEQTELQKQAGEEDTKQENNVDAARMSSVRSTEKLSTEMLDAAEAIKAQDDGKPPTPLQKAQVALSVQKVESAIQSSIEAERSVKQQRDALLATGSGLSARNSTDVTANADLRSLSDLEEQVVVLEAA